MSLMSSGAECSTARNPLAQFTKHTTADRSLQHERFGPASQGATMRAANAPMAASDRQMMNKFMTGETQSSSNNFTFEQMRQELNHTQKTSSPGPQTNWANDFGQFQGSHMPSVTHSSGPAISYTTMPTASSAQWSAEFSTQGPQQQHSTMNGMHSGMGYMNQMPRLYTQPVMSSPASAQTSQSRIKELDDEHWEAQFKQIEEAAQARQKGKGVSVDQVAEEDIAAKEAESVAQDTTASDFERVWGNLHSQVFDNMEEWNTVSEDFAWDKDYNEFSKNRPDFGQYQFEENNQFMQENDPYSIGVRIMESGGNLSEAALAFEAAVQKDMAHAEAWNKLGSVQAQCEKEESAIRALERCVELDPSNLSALNTLAVSYINEAYENAAYSTLEKWIACKYPNIVDQARGQDPSLSSTNLHDRVTQLFIKAAQLSPHGANLDAALQDGLGVLFYGSEEFDKAIDCFNAALAVRPNDPLLWNRLGATLANSRRSEEAIEAYSRALELRPSFVRARYNVGVSCVNIGCYHEAAQHLLMALSMNNIESADPSNVLANKSTNVMSTLKRVFLAMNRQDLYEKVGNGMDISAFRDEFDF